MPKIYDVVAVSGTYMKDGVQKNRYQNIGIVTESQGKHMLKLEAVPINWDGWAYLNEPRIADAVTGKPPVKAPSARVQQRAPARDSRPEAGRPDDDIPWENQR